jgi:hypothetical protein
MSKSLLHRTSRKLKKLLGIHKSYERLINNELTDIEYTAAGSVFTDGKIILAGYQPLKRSPTISGIGGKKEEGETYLETAIRETIEELFEVFDFPKTLITDIKSVIPQRIIQNGKYIMIVYNFADLEEILKIVKKYKILSPLYDKVPMNLMDLIFTRKLVYSNPDPFWKPEISHLSLLPIVNHKGIHFVDSGFIEDMPILLDL